MTTVGAKYWEHVVGIGATDPVTKQLQNVNCGIGRRGVHVTKDGARGTRSPQSGTVGDGPYTVDGPLVIQPSDDEWDKIFEWALGTAASANVYALAETVPERFITQEKIAKVFTWAGCKVNKLTIGSSAGSPVLTAGLEIMGKTEAIGNAGTFPAISGTLTTDQPFLHQQLVCTLNSVVVKVDDVVITVDNMLDGSRFLNSQTRTDIPEQGRRITLDLANPYNVDDVALYNIAVAGISGTLVYTNGSRVLTFSFVNLKAPPDVLEAAGRGEVMNRLKFVAYATGTKELVTTLVQA